MAITDTINDQPTRRWADPVRAERLLSRAGLLWLLVAIAGQMIFAAYVAIIHGREWLIDLPKGASPVEGYVPGHLFTNALYIFHMLFAVIIIVGGALQLLPRLRQWRPAFHRWMGRTYMLAAAILSLGGVALLLLRGTVGSDLMQIGIGVNGLVILLCAGMAWTYARRRRFDLHRRWALRLFLAVSGVWFFRVGLMLWLLIFQAPVGFDGESFTGPFLDILSFAQYLLPLAVLELYFWAQAQRTAGAKLGVAGLVCVLALLTAGGIFGATMGMWLPRM